MPIVYFDHAFISRVDINKAISLFNEIKSKQKPAQMEFVARQRMTDVDVQFFGYLLLFKAEVPELVITLRFPYNEWNESKDGIQFKIRQYSVYVYLSLGQYAFTPFYGKDEIIDNLNWSNQPTFPDSHFVISGDFMPILMVSSQKPALYKLIFETPLNKIPDSPLTLYISNVRWTGNNANLYREISHVIKQDSSPGAHQRSLVNLGKIAFFKALADAKVLSWFLEKAYGQTIRHDFTGNEIENHKQIGYLFSDLMNQPLFYHLLFSTICSVLREQSAADETSESFVKTLKNIWLFCKDLGKGLQEIAKNIIEHSSSHQGILSTRIIKKKLLNTFDSIPGNENRFFSDYQQSLDELVKTQSRLFLSISVFDLGKTGILPTFITRTQNQFDTLDPLNPIRKLLEEDLDQFNSKTVQLQHLLSPEPVIILNQQCKRCIAHVGLLTLNMLVKKNEGVISLNTADEEYNRVNIITREGIKHKMDTIVSGTNVNITLPVNPEKSFETHLPHKLNFPEDQTPDEIRGIHDLLDFDYVNLAAEKANDTDRAKKILGYRFVQQELLDRNDEHKLWASFLEKIDGYFGKSPIKPNYLVHLNFNDVTIDSSQLLRIIGNWEIKFSKYTLLISGVSYEKLAGLLTLNKKLVELSPDIHFWNAAVPVLFYSHVTDEVGDKFYFTDALLGETYDDFLSVNKLIKRNHFNATFALGEEPHTDDGDFRLAENIAFSKQNTLLPFDLILHDKLNTSLFEQNAYMLLKNEIKTKFPQAPAKETNSLLGYVKELPGYKVRKSHYRIGTKLHIEHFYYAKRMFQNNFYASRFAYLLTRTIIKDLKSDEIRKTISDVSKEGLTIIGYGLYSEMLLTLVVSFLVKSNLLKTKDINHNLLGDETNVGLLKKIEPKKNILIVVPIASTFSTAIKVEEISKSNLPAGVHFVPVHYNILHISGAGEPVDPQYLKEEFGWEHINPDNKEIVVEVFSDTANLSRREKYFITLPTEWYRIEDCQICFPRGCDELRLLKETALFETDRTSVTPTIVFDFPRGRKIMDQERKRSYKINQEMIMHGSYAPDNSHFIFSLKTEKFLQDNFHKVRNWLRDIKEEPAFSEVFSEQTHTLIISSCHYSNAAFINLVNERLFHSSANIIHYDPGNDYIQNFELIYGNDIVNAHRIIFIDDTMKSGRTFDQIDDFIKQVQEKRKNTPKKGIAACFILINKTQQREYDLVINKLDPVLGKIFSFANIHSFNSLSHPSNTTIRNERRRYMKIIDDSFIDSLKYHFTWHISKLINTDVQQKSDFSENGGNSHSDIDDDKRERHILVIDATHRVYEYFSKTFSFDENVDFRSFLRQMHKSVTSPLDYNIANFFECLDLKPIDLAILKVFTQYPFTQYEPLRKASFVWTINLLHEQIQVVSERISDPQLKLRYDDLLGLKFLMRRSCLMNSNYLLSPETFEFMKKLYSTAGIPDLLERTRNDTTLSDIVRNERCRAIHYFTVFFCAQVKELLSKNPARAIRLEGTLRKFDSNTTDGFLQVIRILLVENCIAIQKFYEFLSQTSNWKELYKEESSELDHTKSDKGIQTMLLTSHISRHHHYKMLTKFFSVEKKTGSEEIILPANKRQFIYYLWIKHYMQFDEPKQQLSLTRQTNAIFKKLTLLMNAVETQGFNTGMFLTVRDNRNKSYLVYDQNQEAANEFDSEYWANERTAYLEEFLDGKETEWGKSFKTLMELQYTQVGWIDMYSIRKSPEILLPPNFLGYKHDRLILMRLTRITGDLKSEKKLGLLGIYFKRVTAAGRGRTDAETIRYLLLLKNDLAGFIERHHQNSEFRDWLVSEKSKRLSLLAGHSKEMLKKLSLNPLFNKIALDMEHIQLIMLLVKDGRQAEEMADIKAKFNQFYHVGGDYSITHDYHQDLKKMAEDIFASNAVETKVDIEIISNLENTDTSFKFPFSKSILNVISFELLINAKKNRWHFLPGDTPLKNIIKSDYDWLENKHRNKNNFDKNRLMIFLGSEKNGDDDDMLKLQIINTGPAFGNEKDEILDALNDPNKNVKKDSDSIAGTSLLKTLISSILGGSIKYDNKKLCNATNFSNFEATVLLKPMKKSDEY